MELSVSYSDLKTERYFDQDSCFDQRKVKVYIRTVSRKSVKIELPAQITLERIKEIVWKKFNISDQDQVLYLKGTCLNYNLLILLQNNWIIHVINLAQVKLSEINVQIKVPSVKKKGNSNTKIVFSPKISVLQFIKSYILPQYQINIDEILLVESGRILRTNDTFIEQNIQSGTTINLIHSKKDQFVPSSFIQPLPQVIKAQIKTDQVQDENSQSNSVKTIKKSESKISNLNKVPKSKVCAIHDSKQQLSEDYYQKTLSYCNSSKTERKLNENSAIKSMSTLIGQRECNCKKQKQINLFKQPKFITAEDKKRLSKQIRQHNLYKLMRIKQKKEEQIFFQPITQQKTLKKVQSLQLLKPFPITERKAPAKIARNPQKNFKC